MTPLPGWLRSLLGAGDAAAARTRVDRVAPWLYIGPALPDDGLAALPARGVTHVLDLRDEASDDPALLERLGLRWQRVPMVDREPPGEGQLEAIVEWLDGEADDASEQAVYVHCHAGISRTATVAIALLMHQDLTLAEARRLVFAARPVVAPTPRQMDWLEALEARLRPPA